MGEEAIDDRPERDEEQPRNDEGGIEPDGGKRADPQREPDGGPPPWYQPESGQPGPREPPPEVGDASDD